MPLRIGFWGGTFDPVHRGHLQMAEELRQALKLDHISMIPAKLPPHRTATSSAEHRFNMLRLALEHYPDLHVDDQEIKREGLSFSLLTCQAYRQKYPKAQLFLCMGTDAFTSFNTWYKWQDIINLVNIAVVKRPGFSLINTNDYIEELGLQELSSKPDKLTGAFVELCLSALPISSTQIRAELAQTQHVPSYLPDSVWQYIQQHKLYFK